MSISVKRFTALTVAALVAGVCEAAPTLDGQIGSEGYIHATETPYAQPVLGGQPGSSDLIGETAAQHRWDGTTDVNLGSTRGDVQNLFVQWDGSFLYIAVEGPTIPFATWNGPNGSSGNEDGDQGDLYIAIDTRGGTASSSDYLVANDAHRTFHNADNPQAVDFQGWQPTYFIGVEDVQNGTFAAGSGWANVEQAGTHFVSAQEGQNSGNGGFEWSAGFDGSRGIYEFAVPWADLGFSGPPQFELRLAAYTTFDDDYHDTYDSASGMGQPSVFEEIGDHPFDLDTGSGDDGLFAGFAGSFGVPAGAFPGSNFVDPNTYNYGAVPNRADEIDTIQEYFVLAVPEPGSAVLASLALLIAGLLRRRSR